MDFSVPEQASRIKTALKPVVEQCKYYDDTSLHGLRIGILFLMSSSNGNP